ncbi:MAG: hypothetical protein WBG71_11040 [Leeuwenhoekiella sp.]
MSNDKKSEEAKTYNSDIRKDEMDVLKQKNLHKDDGVDEQLRDREHPVDFTGKDLDVPGAENARKNQGSIGLRDEENKLHSQGWRSSRES